MEISKSACSMVDTQVVDLGPRKINKNLKAKSAAGASNGRKGARHLNGSASEGSREVECSLGYVTNTVDSFGMRPQVARDLVSQTGRKGEDQPVKDDPCRKSVARVK